MRHSVRPFVAICVPALFCGLAGCVDREVNSGSAYGFTIGQSKHEAYSACMELFANQKISGITTLKSEAEEREENAGALRELTILEAEQQFNDWTFWEIYEGHSRRLVGRLQFRDGVLIQDAGKTGSTHNEMLTSKGIRSGASYREVFAALKEIDERLGNTLVLQTAWMSRRQPTTFSTAEFRLVQAYDKWRLYYGSGRSTRGALWLVFREEELAQIRRTRSFELP